MCTFLCFRKADVRGLITAGEDKFFSTGMDVDWLKRSSPEILDRYHDNLHRLYIRILNIGVTSVAVINGKVLWVYTQFRSGQGQVYVIFTSLHSSTIQVRSSVCKLHFTSVQFRSCQAYVSFTSLQYISGQVKCM